MNDLNVVADEVDELLMALTADLDGAMDRLGEYTVMLAFRGETAASDRLRKLRQLVLDALLDANELLLEEDFLRRNWYD